MIVDGPGIVRPNVTARTREAIAPARGPQPWINPRSSHSIEIRERVVKERNAHAIRILIAASRVPIQAAIEAAACLGAASVVAASEVAAVAVDADVGS